MKRKGVASLFFGKVEQLARARRCASFRVDTNHDNERMQKLLAKLGFTFRGKIQYQKGERLAFDNSFEIKS